MQPTNFSTGTRQLVRLAIVILVAAVQVNARSFAQQVTLQVKQAPLIQVFKAIESQTGYYFLYDDALVQQAPKVTVSITNAPLAQALEQCFKNQQLDYKIVNRTIVVKAKDPARTPAVTAPPTDVTPVVIHGVVKDAASGKPVADATIINKTSRQHTFSGADGSFDIPAEKGDVLQLSLVDYDNQEVTVKSNTGISIQLAQKQRKDSLTQVVITGYQTINKDNYTGTAVSVSGDDLKKVNPQNVLQSLQAFDPSFKITDNNLVGSNPNRLPVITVRGSTALPNGVNDVIGRNNLTGNTNLPTFIMDGYEVTLEKVYDLDINRIQSITLLKDAAATAVYGSRAANGVVVITTRAPKPGKLRLSYSYDMNLVTPDLSDYHVLDAAQKLDYEQLAGLYDGTKNSAVSQYDLDIAYYHKKQNVVSGVNSYWLSQPLKTAVGQKHSVYLEGGTESIRYGLELRYQTNPGVMKGSSRDRYSVGMNLAYNAGKRLLFKNTLTVTQMKARESPYGDFANYVRMNPYYPVRDSAGHVLQDVDAWNARDAGSGKIVSVHVLNPMYNATLGGFNKSDYLELIDAFGGEWTIANGLRLRAQISYTQNKATTDEFISPFDNIYYFYSADKINQRGQYTYQTSTTSQVDAFATLNYNRQLGEHNLNLALGTNVQTSNLNQKQFTAIGFANDRFPDIGFAAGYGENGKPQSDVYKDRLIGSFLTFNYSFKNKYLLDFTFREDGSSKFGSDKRIAPFNTLGIGWNLHKEKLLQGTNISQLKLRASTGLIGSVSFPAYMATTTYTYVDQWYSSGPGVVLSNYGNSNLQWQKTRTYDFGIDLGLFNDALVLSPRLYTKLTRGLLADISLPPSTGFSYYKDNLGDMRNTGQELSVHYNMIHTRNWQAGFNLNLARNENTIVRISNALKAYNDRVDEAQGKDDNKGAPLLRYAEGQSVDAIYAVRSLGIDPENGRELFVKKNGSLTYDWDVKDNVAITRSTPKVFGFLMPTVAWKQLMVQATLYSSFGGKQYNQTLVDRVENADPHLNVDSRALEQKWKQPGDHTFYKNIADLGQTFTSSRFIQKDSRVELQSVYVAYNLQKKLYERMGMQYLRLAVTANDLWRWSTIKIERGIDYPYARSLTFTLQAGF
ncbi:SusC/RagA family TonB-linked outer membrane protein [Deminuibacter soli]|uniref:SusC/RagA family TonB-linked outer membrane protein n=1 Tax=Deminuibacter soli TaxID=2291815 RepID=A0A3E1NJV1_9BACT|nr:SusC/RagA family TonB-linked outer membrane protein [Deminuibacter soli]RFM28202.1 SusC/RagA family TonB-linked outer membrane protein [Deminuibacter soli]